MIIYGTNEVIDGSSSIRVTKSNISESIVPTVQIKWSSQILWYLLQKMISINKDELF